MQQSLTKLLYRFHQKPRLSRNYRLSQEQVHYIAGSLDQLMDDERPFLRLQYHIRDLSRDIGIPIWQLSLFLNREIGLNFKSFINHYRVWYCERLIQSGLSTTEDVDSLAARCGFSSGTALSMTFKKLIGFSSFRYIKAWTMFLNEGDTEL